MITRTQLITVALMFVFWLAGCTMGQAYTTGTVPPVGSTIPAATLVPCDTPTTAASAGLTNTLTLSATNPISGAAPISGTMPLTATPAATTTQVITIAPPLSPTAIISLTPPLTVTAQPTSTPVSTTTVQPTAAPGQTLTPTTQPTRTVTATQPATRTGTPATPIAPTRVPTGTTTPPATTAPQPTPVASAAPPATATRPPQPTMTNTATSTSTPTRTATPTPSATPSPSPTPTGGTPTDTPTAAPVGEVYVRSHRGFATDGGYVVVGEVVNALGVPVFGVRVQATFVNANGQEVASQEGYAFLAQTSPDQRNPFRIQVDNPAHDITSYQLQVQWDDISVVTFQDLTVLSQQLSETNGQQEVIGEVQNDFTENLGSIVLAVVLYDEAGQVVEAYQSTPQATQMAPNEVSPYAVPVAPDQPFKSFSVQAQGKRAIFF